MEKFSFGENTPQNNKKKKISRRDFLKAGVAGAVAGAAAFLNACDERGAPQKEKTENFAERLKENLKEKRVEAMVRKEHEEDRRSGYADLNHFLKDYPEVKNNPEDLEDARRYFEEQEDE